LLHALAWGWAQIIDSFGWIFVFLEQKSGQNGLRIKDLVFSCAAGW